MSLTLDQQVDRLIHNVREGLDRLRTDNYPTDKKKGFEEFMRGLHPVDRTLLGAAMHGNRKKVKRILEAINGKGKLEAVIKTSRSEGRFRTEIFIKPEGGVHRGVDPDRWSNTTGGRLNIESTGTGDILLFSSEGGAVHPLLVALALLALGLTCRKRND